MKTVKMKIQRKTPRLSPRQNITSLQTLTAHLQILWLWVKSWATCATKGLIHKIVIDCLLTLMLFQTHTTFLYLRYTIFFGNISKILKNFCPSVESLYTQNSWCFQTFIIKWCNRSILKRHNCFILGLEWRIDLRRIRHTVYFPGNTLQ